MMLILQGPRTRLAGLEWRRFGQHILAYAAFLLIFYLEICLVNLALSAIYGSAMSCQSIWAENFSDVRLHLGSCTIVLYAGGVLVDIAETVRSCSHLCPSTALCELIRAYSGLLHHLPEGSPRPAPSCPGSWAPDISGMGLFDVRRPIGWSDFSHGGFSCCRVDT